MEIIKKKILRKLKLYKIPVTGCTGMCEFHNDKNCYFVKYGNTEYVIKPDLESVYNFKINLVNKSKSFGFFDVSEKSNFYYYPINGDGFIPGIGEILVLDINYI